MIPRDHVLLSMIRREAADHLVLKRGNEAGSNTTVRSHPVRENTFKNGLLERSPEAILKEEECRGG
jgi:hypothetical protein